MYGDTMLTVFIGGGDGYGAGRCNYSSGDGSGDAFGDRMGDNFTRLLLVNELVTLVNMEDET